MRIKKTVLPNALVVISFFGLVACSSVGRNIDSDDEIYEAENTIQTNSAVYNCNGKPLAILFHADQAQLSWQKKEYQLTQAVSASGASYLGEGVSFWIHSDEGMLELRDMKKLQCQLVRVES
ncbi:MliC family protein [Marinomonas shanghaiensis]|uniref:MliC family protein n=1 Tax=Marinomonas shanghaiensis TaxID=2202418 RepID=UPI003A93C663